MESKKRVLIAGIGQSNFLKQLYSAIHQVAPSKFEFDIYGLKELSGKDEYGVDVFSDIYKVRNSLKIKDFKNLFSLKLLYSILKFLRNGASIIKVLVFIKSFIITKSEYNKYDLDKYKVIHIHFPTYNYLQLFWHIKDDVKCIVSFWGSDLMRQSGVFNYYVQSCVLSRADVITTHGNETKQQILTKFGRDLESKVIYTRFPPFEQLYLLIQDKLKQQKSEFEDFFKRLKIPYNKKVIVVGHNGHSANNHLKVIASLSVLPKEIKEAAFFVLPFSYGKSKDSSYEEKCREMLAAAGLEGKIMTDFLSWDDLSIFKRVTDIMIHMPVSDALSGAMTEAIFAGSKVITGDWLPYSPFIKEGLIFEISDFDNLADTFSRVFNTLTENETVVLENREIIKNKFLSDYCAKTWLPALS